MSRTPLSRGRAWAAALAAFAGLAALTGQSSAAATPVEDAPTAVSDAVSDGVRTVAYHGYRITVPDDWRVVDLAENPRTCVRFDTPALYLGTPGDQSSCTAEAVGRTAAIVVEPITERSARQTTEATARTARGAATASGAESRDGAVQLAVEDAGVVVTAAHTPQTESLVRGILATAKLTGSARRTELPAVQEGATPLAAAGPQPGSFLGKGFDACAAPSQSVMDAWLAASPYRAVGVYISGPTRACAQPNLTASWVSTQTGKGWRLLPIDVGKQAPCGAYSNKMSGDAATARTEGAAAAAASVTVAQGLGIPPGSAIYSDIEGYSGTASCTAAVLSYLSGWTDALHERGYLSGFYSSASSGISDAADNYGNAAYTRVDHIWFAWWNNLADTNTGSYVPAGYWADHQRLHQYAGEVGETWGGATIAGIDRNYLDTGTGTPPSSTCPATSLDFTAYPTVRSGATGSLVKAAQCLLQAAGHDPGPGTPTGTFDAATVTAAQSFQSAKGLTADGVVGSHTWTALLSRGTTPTLQNGSTGEAVRRLQRALTSALGRTVAIDGAFGSGTTQAVRDYQTANSLTADGIAGPATWAALQSGK